MATTIGLRCSRCGAPCDIEDGFCGSCGTRIELPALPAGKAAEADTTAIPAPEPGPARLGGALRLLRNRKVVGGVVILLVAATAIKILPGGGSGAISASLLGSLPTNEPARKWSFPLGETSVSDLTADGGIVFTVTVNAGDAKLIATRESDGKERWRTDLAGDVSDAVVFPLGGLVVTAGERVEAFTRSGKAKWSYEPEGSIVHAEPVGGDSVLVVASKDRRGTTEHTVTLVRAGKERWSVDGTSATVAGDRVLVADKDRVDVYRVADGRTAWSTDLGSGSTGAVLGDLALISDGKDITAYRASDGKKLWSKNPGIGSIDTASAVDDSHVLLNGGDGAAVLDRSGNVTWDDNETHYGRVLPLGGKPVLVESDGDTIDVLDLLTQRKLASHDLDSSQVFPRSGIGSPLAGNGLLIEDGSRVRGLSMPGLTEQWSFKTDGDDIDGLFALHNAVLTVTNDGTDTSLALYR